MKGELDSIKGAMYSIPSSAIGSLGVDPDVAYVTPDRPVQGFVDYATVAVGADIARSYGWEGTGIGVAVIDSGISATWDLANGTSSNAKSRVLYNQSFVGRKTTDEFGHGSHVAGIVAGNGNYSTAFSYSTRAFRGIAPKANIINLRVLDANGAGTDSGVIAAIQQAIQLKAKYNIRVINLSLGRPVFESYTSDPLCQAVEAAWKAGIVVVVSAGNEGRNNSAGVQGYGTIASPGNDPYVITVGAMKTPGHSDAVG